MGGYISCARRDLCVAMIFCVHASITSRPRDTRIARLVTELAVATTQRPSIIQREPKTNKDCLYA